jgi:hypothetical protein
MTKSELETQFRNLAELHSLACECCNGLPSLVDPEDSAYRDRVYARLQRAAIDLISDVEIWDLEDSTADRDILHFCRLALEDNDTYARFECYLISLVAGLE